MTEKVSEIHITNENDGRLKIHITFIDDVDITLYCEELKDVEQIIEKAIRKVKGKL